MPDLMFLEHRTDHQATPPMHHALLKCGGHTVSLSECVVSETHRLERIKGNLNEAWVNDHVAFLPEQAQQDPQAFISNLLDAWDKHHLIITKEGEFLSTLDRLHLSQRAFANRTGISTQTVVNARRSGRYPLWFDWALQGMSAKGSLSYEEMVSALNLKGWAHKACAQSPLNRLISERHQWRIETQFDVKKGLTLECYGVSAHGEKTDSGSALLTRLYRDGRLPKAFMPTVYQAKL
ncbi:hypothetical protein AB6D11_00765 [Vibrio splendidus]